jgi:hypothetical protein
MAKLQILHPITHNKTEFGRGIYEIGKDIAEDLAKFFMAKMPHAARLYSPDAVNQPGTIKPAPDAASAGVELNE